MVLGGPPALAGLGSRDCRRRRSRAGRFDCTHDMRIVRLPLTSADWGIFNLRTLHWCGAWCEDCRKWLNRFIVAARWMLRRVMRGADFVIANSQSTKEILISGWGLPESKVRIMYPGVDTQRFVPAERGDTERARLGWSGCEVGLTDGHTMCSPRRDNERISRARRILSMQVGATDLKYHFPFSR